MGFFWTTLLLCHLLPSLIHSLTCFKEKQYEWGTNGIRNPTKCCNKCKPGEYMKSRCLSGSEETECLPCQEGWYTDVYNTDSRCKKCRCGEHQVEVNPCSQTKNTECKCEPGYRCSDAKCLDCVKMDKTHKVTTSSQPTWPTTTKATETSDNKEPHDAVLLPVVLTVCVCILILIIATKHKKFVPLCCCKIDDLSPSEDTQSTEDEAVPVQEVCSDCQEVWIKDGLDKERIFF